MSIIQFPFLISNIFFGMIPAPVKVRIKMHASTVAKHDHLTVAEVMDRPSTARIFLPGTPEVAVPHAASLITTVFSNPCIPATWQ